MIVAKADPPPPPLHCIRWYMYNGTSLAGSFDRVGKKKNHVIHYLYPNPTERLFRAGSEGHCVISPSL